MCWFNPMGPSYWHHVGVPQLLPQGHTVSNLYHHTGAVDCTFPGWGLGRHGKAIQDMAFLLMVPSLAIRCEWVFGLTAMLTHPHQVHLPTLADTAQNLLLLVDEGANWPYAYIWMNDAVAHVPLSSEGHIGIMTGGLPSCNACSHLHQLHVWQLL